MNTVLIIFILYGSTFIPEYAISYATEAQCTAKIDDYTPYPFHHRKAICVPAVEIIKLEPADNGTGVVKINKLMEEQAEALGVSEKIVNTDNYPENKHRFEVKPVEEIHKHMHKSHKHIRRKKLR